MKIQPRFGSMLLMFFLVATLAWTQDNNAAEADSQPAAGDPISAFIGAFDRVDDVGKLEVVRSTLESPVAPLEDFYGQVISYVLNNADQVFTNTNIREMAMLSFPRIIEGGFTSLNDSLWYLFDQLDETFWRIEILEVMAAVGQGDEQLAINLADWLDGQNQSKRAGTRPDFQVVFSAVQTLGALADPVVYPVLVDTVLNQYSEDISAAALAAINEYPDRTQLLIDTIGNSQPPQKREFFTLFLDRDEFDDVILDVSYQVLLDVLETRPNNLEERIILDQVRMDAVRVLAAQPSPEYAPALISHFNAAYQAFDRGTADKGLVLEAIGALGKTDSTAAAIRLAEFLDLINTYTELDRPFDRQITLAVINNLANLGKPEAYNALFMVTVLNYSNAIQEVAEQALVAVSQ